jgi:hypothetical protein
MAIIPSYVRSYWNHPSVEVGVADFASTTPQRLPAGAVDLQKEMLPAKTKPRILKVRSASKKGLALVSDCFSCRISVVFGMGLRATALWVGHEENRCMVRHSQSQLGPRRHVECNRVRREKRCLKNADLEQKTPSRQTSPVTRNKQRNFSRPV